MKQVPPRKTCCLLLFVCFLCTWNFLSAQVVINEFSAANKSDYANDNGEYKDWIELYNAGNSSVNLAGYYLSDKLNNTTKWQFPNGISIAANDRLIPMASDSSRAHRTRDRAEPAGGVASTRADEPHVAGPAGGHGGAGRLG